MDVLTHHVWTLWLTEDALHCMDYGARVGRGPVQAAADAAYLLSYILVMHAESG